MKIGEIISESIRGEDRQKVIDMFLRDKSSDAQIAARTGHPLKDVAFVLGNLRNNLAFLNKVSAAGVKLVPLVKHPESGKDVFIYDNGRYVVLVDINGFHMPFYVSTGLGGKQTVEADKWYPFFGIGDDKWFNKATEKLINVYYNSPKLKKIAQILNQAGKPLRDNLNVRGWQPGGELEAEFTANVNKHLKPVSLKGSKELHIKNINDTIKRIEGNSTVEPTSDPPQPPSETQVGPVVKGPLSLVHNDKPFTSLRISTPVGRAILKQLGPDYKFWDDEQFKLVKNTDDTWDLHPNTSATNKTMINGKLVTQPTKLKQGMRISAGNPDKQIEKLPIHVA